MYIYKISLCRWKFNLIIEVNNNSLTRKEYNIMQIVTAQTTCNISPLTIAPICYNNY